MRHLRHIVMLAAIAAPVSAHAAGQGFTLVNRTGYQIDHVFVSPSDSRNWGGSAMAASKLDDGQGMDIGLSACRTPCRWDLRVEFHDGQKATWSSLDLGYISKMSLFWNQRTRTTTAEAH